MNPGNESFAGSCFSAQSCTHQLEECLKYSSWIRAHGHGAAQGDLARLWCCRGKELFFPTGCHFDAETPSVRRVRFIAAEFAAGFIHRTIESMTVDCGGAGIQPKGGRLSCFG